MDKNSNRMYAVLTGDIVESGKLPGKQFQEAKDCLKKASVQLNTLVSDIKGLVKGNIDFYRGDSWQLLLTEPQYALRACLYMRAYLKADGDVDTRVSAGIGPVSTLNIKNISQSTGEAFELSGTALDKLKGRKRMTVSLPYYLEEKSIPLISVYELCDVLVQKWTQKQAEAVSWALEGKKQEQVAEKMKPAITSQNAGKHLRASGWYALESVLERTEKKTC
jgi:hypothetical protein